MDIQRLRAQEKRQARQLEIREALWLRKAELLEQFHEFTVGLQKEGALQAVSDSGKLVLAVIPGAAVLGDAADALDNAVNLHDLYGILSQLKDISDLDNDEEAALMDVLARNELGRRVLEGKIEIAALETELATLGSADWGHPELPTHWAWWIPSTYWRWMFSTAWRRALGGNHAHDKYAEVFAIVDKDKDGCIDRAEFTRVLRRLEAIDDHWKELAKGDAHIFFLKADADGDGKISVEDFALWVRTTGELVAYFQALDHDRDGLIDKEEFKEVVAKIADQMRRMQEADAQVLVGRDVDAEFQEIDSNADGQINLPEFVGWMQGSTALGLYAFLSRMARKSRAKASTAMDWSASSLAGRHTPGLSSLHVPSLTGWLVVPKLPGFRHLWRRQFPAAAAQPEPAKEEEPAKGEVSQRPK